MAKFKDRHDREWVVEITVGTVKRVRKLLDIDIADLLSDKKAKLWDFIANPVDLVDVLYVVCKPQADAEGITDEQFGESLAGPSLKAATDAFLEGYADFFADPEKSKLLRQAVRKANEGLSKVTAKAMKELEAIDLETLVKSSTNPSTGLSVSSASTPTPSPMANS